MFITLKNGIRIPCQSAKTQSVIISTSVHAHLSALLTLLSEASFLSPRVHGIGQEAGSMQTSLEPVQNASHRRCEKFMSSGCFNPGPSHTFLAASLFWLFVVQKFWWLSLAISLHPPSCSHHHIIRFKIRKRWAKSMHASCHTIEPTTL